MNSPSDSSDMISLGSHGPVTEVSLVSGVEKTDLEARLRIVRRKKNRHFLWTILGFSPGAAIPMLGLMREGNPGLVVLLSGLVVVVEGYSWYRAARETRRLEEELKLLSDGRGVRFPQHALGNLGLREPSNDRQSESPLGGSLPGKGAS